MFETAGRPVVETEFHFDLSDAYAKEDYFLNAFGQRYLLVRHTAATREAAKAAWACLAGVRDDRLTHYCPHPVTMPADRVVRVHVKHTLEHQQWASATFGVGNTCIHCPPPSIRLSAASLTAVPYCQFIDYVSTAQTLLFHHPDLITVDPTVHDAIYSAMTDDKFIADLIEDLATTMRDMGPSGEGRGWAWLEPYVPPPNPQTGVNPDNKTFYVQTPTQEVQTAAGPAMTALMKATKNNLALEGTKWTQPEGTTVLPNSQAPQRIEGNGESWSPALQTTDSNNGVVWQIAVLDSAKNQLSLTVQNNYIRFLGIYVRFFNSADHPISVPTWTPDGGGEPLSEAMDIQYDDMRYIGHVGPQNNLLAIPIPPPGTLTASITFPAEATSATLYASGIGTGSDTWPKSPVVGGLLTGIVNLGIPTFLLAAGAAAQAFGPAYGIVQTLLKQTPFITSVLEPLISLFSTFGTNGEMKMNWGALGSLFKALFNKAATQLLIWVETQMAVDEVLDEIPFAGWIMVGINIATGVAQLAETIIEVATSPWNIENTISITIATEVVVNPDPRQKAFPTGKSGEELQLVVKLIYKSQNRPTRTDTAILTDAGVPTITATFANNTLGGQVKVEADYYIGDWMAGKATSGWLANDEVHARQISLFLVELPVPLTSTSIYTHAALLAYQDNNYIWINTPTAPVSTIANANTSSSGNAISEWAGLVHSQRAGMLGYSWKAAGMGVSLCGGDSGGQLFAMQNVDIPGVPMAAAKFPSCGLAGETLLAYDPYPPKFLMVNGQWSLGPDGRPLPDPGDASLGNYYIDPRKAINSDLHDGGYHLRLITLDNITPFDMSTNQLSYGRFRLQPDSVAIHPSGHVVAINQQHKRLQIARMCLEGAPDEALPMARIYAGEAQNVDRHGLLFHPVAVTCSHDGTILVLEDTSSGTPGQVVLARIQAFDLHGRPVSRFVDANGRPTPFLNISTTGANTYLDLAAVGSQHTTYMYVLYYTGDGHDAADYNMAIYQYADGAAPATNPLVTTQSIPASHVAVDMWHTAFLLNYEMTTDGSGHNSGPSSGGNSGPAGRTVPSVSQWVPPVG